MMEDQIEIATEFGKYIISQRRSDGAWEYATPDEDFGDHNQHIIDDLDLGQAVDAVSREYAARLCVSRLQKQNSVPGFAFFILGVVGGLLLGGAFMLDEPVKALFAAISFLLVMLAATKIREREEN